MPAPGCPANCLRAAVSMVDPDWVNIPPPSRDADAGWHRRRGAQTLRDAASRDGPAAASQLVARATSPPGPRSRSRWRARRARWRARPRRPDRARPEPVRGGLTRAATERGPRRRGQRKRGRPYGVAGRSVHPEARPGPRRRGDRRPRSPTTRRLGRTTCSLGSRAQQSVQEAAQPVADRLARRARSRGRRRARTTRR